MMNHADGTVTDERTGLMWEQRPSDTRYSWADATGVRIAELNASTLGGHTDWRLPELWELVSLVDYARSNPAIDPLLSCQSTTYWSATTYQPSPSTAWGVYFYDGYVSAYNKSFSSAVRGVRGGS